MYLKNSDGGVSCQWHYPHHMVVWGRRGRLVVTGKEGRVRRTRIDERLEHIIYTTKIG